MNKTELDSVTPEEINAILRNSYIIDINSINPFDRDEAKDIKETLDWLKTSPALHKPFNMDRHLGVLFFLLSPDRKSTFLINHKKAQAWLPPGGHVDFGLSFQEAVDLEMKEELQTDVRFIDPRPFMLTQTLTTGLNAGHVDVTAWFLVEGDTTQQYAVQKKEASEAKWFSLDEIAEGASFPHISRAARKIQAIH